MHLPRPRQTPRHHLRLDRARVFPRVLGRDRYAPDPDPAGRVQGVCLQVQGQSDGELWWTGYVQSVCYDGLGQLDNDGECEYGYFGDDCHYACALSEWMEGVRRWREYIVEEGGLVWWIGCYTPLFWCHDLFLFYCFCYSAISVVNCFTTGLRKRLLSLVQDIWSKIIGVHK